MGAEGDVVVDSARERTGGVAAYAAGAVKVNEEVALAADVVGVI